MTATDRALLERARFILRQYVGLLENVGCPQVRELLRDLSARLDGGEERPE